ncbi:hypothetical protein ACQJBY_016315 [Aegilops geniculata]
MVLIPMSSSSTPMSSSHAPLVSLEEQPPLPLMVCPFLQQCLASATSENGRKTTSTSYVQSGQAVHHRFPRRQKIPPHHHLSSLNQYARAAVRMLQGGLKQPVSSRLLSVLQVRPE